MTDTAKKTDPTLWDKVKTKVQREDKGGKPGQWSARKAQLAVHDYKQAGGGYKGKKSADNHLAQWTKEDWGTKSGKESGKTGERYLPKKARAKMSDADYKKTTERKRADTANGKQFSSQPKKAAEVTKSARLEEMTVADLRQRAATAKVAGRSKMNKAALIEVLSEA